MKHTLYLPDDLSELAEVLREHYGIKPSHLLRKAVLEAGERVLSGEEPEPLPTRAREMIKALVAEESK